MSNNLDLILDATEEKEQGRRESDQEFLTRVLEATHSLLDAKWKALPRDLKNWYNEGSEAFNAEDPIPALPGAYEEEEEEEEKPARGRGRGKKAPARGRGRASRNEEEEEPEEEEEEKPTRGRGRGRGKAASAGRGRGRSAGKSEDTPDVPISRRIRQILAGNPNTSREKMERVLTKEGYEVKASTVRITMSTFAEVYEALEDEGRIVAG